MFDRYVGMWLYFGYILSSHALFYNDVVTLYSIHPQGC
jgi:hypothetical protein